MDWPYRLYTEEEENEHGDMIPIPGTLEVSVFRNKLAVFRYDQERGPRAGLGTQWVFEVYWPYGQWGTKNIFIDTTIRVDWNKHQYGLQILGFGFGWDAPTREDR